LQDSGKKKNHHSSIDVQHPTPTEASPVTRKNKCVPSKAYLMQKDQQLNENHFQNYLKYTLKITLPVTYEKLTNKLIKKEKDKLEKVMSEDLGPSQPARCTSAQYFDMNGKPLLFYFGKRLVYPEKTVPVGPFLSAFSLYHYFNSLFRIPLLPRISM
jgi:hypothetical protein